MVSWHYFAAGLLAVLTRAGFSQIGHARYAGTNAVVINAHDHTAVVHQAVAALGIPDLMIIDTKERLAPTFASQVVMSFYSAAIFLVLFLFFLWLLRRIWPVRPTPDLTNR